MLDPAGPWSINYDRTQCTAARIFGPAADPIVLAIIPSISGETFDIVVSDGRPGPKFARQMNGAVDLGSGPIELTLLHSTAKEKGSSQYRFRLTNEQMAQAAGANALLVQVSRNNAFHFPPANMKALLDGLGKCTAELQAYWNYEIPFRTYPQGQRAATAAKGDIRPLFTNQDFPDEAMWANAEGKAQYSLLIDDNGAVAGCYLLRASGAASLDAMGCQVIMSRATFTPAIDTTGRPMRTVVTTPPVNFRIEK